MTDRSGFTIGELLIVFAAAILFTAALTPFIRYSNDRMARVDCANNIRKIGLAMYIYARENEGDFPPSLEALYLGQYLGDAGIMDCPANRIQGTINSPDYLYVPGLSVRDPSGTVLLRDRRGNHPRGGGNVLYVDGTVEWEDYDPRWE